MPVIDTTLRFSSAERARFAADGFVVRQKVLSGQECEAVGGHCEELIAEIGAIRRAERVAAGSYVFEPLRPLSAVIKWEPDAPDVIQGIEPFAHISKPLGDLGVDPRLLDPCKDIVGDENIELFTEKMNLKRARRGGAIALHQDVPYWEQYTSVAPRIATAMLFIDAATRANGCLEVAPGSHKEGTQRRYAGEGMAGLEMDPRFFDMTRLVPLEADVGTVIYLHPFLVHRSRANQTDVDRRALAYSYQPAGYPHVRELVTLDCRPGRHGKKSG